jgi:hypothetical protein
MHDPMSYMITQKAPGAARFLAFSFVQRSVDLNSRHSFRRGVHVSRLIVVAIAVLTASTSGFDQSLPKINAPGKPWKQLSSPRGGPTKIDDVEWVKFTDPNEHAFTVDVPAGWETVGGAVRRNAIDVSAFLRVLSPDVSMMLVSGDPGPAFFPTAGFASHPDDRGYVEGRDYAKQWGERMLAPLCSEVKSIRDADRHDLEKGKFAAPGFSNHAGEVVFSCMHKGEPEMALVVASTFNLPVRCCDIPTIWGVSVLCAWIGPPDHVRMGRQMIEHMMASSQNDAEWERAQEKRVRDAWGTRFRPDQTQTPEWAATRKKAEAQLGAVNQKFNPQAADTDQP